VNESFASVAVMGGGLLGGSLALAMAARGRGDAVRLWARRQETVDQARELGISHVTTDLAAAIHGADLVVLATPVGAMADLAARMLDAGLPAGTLVTDVGSVKRLPQATVAPVLAARGVRFLGSHPMAGSEQNGIQAASADLFDGAACLLTNDGLTRPEDAVALENFWAAVGCRVSWTTAAAHDELVARISHFPHAVAALCAQVALRHPDDGRFAGGGLRDTTRVASGEAGLWAEILMENREAVAEPLREMAERLREMLAMLDAGEQERLRHFLADAKSRRDGISRNH
jgi:prephenate dehydrogenase